jgi:hypothetical protein
MISQYVAGPGDYVWFDNVYWTYSTGWTDQDHLQPLASWSAPKEPTHSYVTNSYAYNGVYGFVVTELARNVTTEQTSGAPFLSPNLLINATVKNFNGTYNGNKPNSYHRDVFHSFDNGDNRIVYGLTATDRVAAQVINVNSDAGAQSTNYAFVNITATPDMVDNTAEEPNWGGPQWTQLEGGERHIVFINLNMPTQRVVMDPVHHGGSSDFYPQDVVFKDCSLHWDYYERYVLDPSAIIPGVYFENCQPATYATYAVTDLGAVIQTNQAHLTWSNLWSTADNFFVLRSDDGGSTWMQLATLSATATSYNDAGLVAGKKYLYLVRSIDQPTGMKKSSNIASVGPF